MMSSGIIRCFLFVIVVFHLGSVTAKKNKHLKNQRSTVMTTERPTPAGEKVDIIFVIDGTSSITDLEFQGIKEDLKKVISKIPIGEDSDQVGILQFSDEPEIEVSLNRHVNRKGLISAINKIEQLKGEDRIDLALETLSKMFSLLYGARKDATRACIIITDGKSQETEDVEAPSKDLRAQNVEMLAIGIGSGVNISELEAITGDPSQVYFINSYSELGEALEKAVTKARKASGFLVITEPTPTKDPCFDIRISPSCSMRQRYNLRFCRFDPLARTHCRRTCVKCLPQWRLKKRDCIDKWKNCTRYDVNLCTTGTFSGNCDHFCGSCDADGLTTGFHGKCFYKGKVYETGDSWRVGCDYDCTCVDGRQGTYECFNRCPIYFDLPIDCTLVRKEGDCCLRPVCNFQKMVTQINRTSVGIDSTGENVCEYNGTQYRQNEYFQDGCDWQCQCVKAEKGQIACSSLCPTYSALPSPCRLVQDEGSCCKRLVCEFSTAVGKLLGHGTTTGYAEGRAVDDISCRDERSDCHLFAKTTCVDNKDYMTKNCPVFCDLCEEKYRKSRCHFGYETYTEGEEWTRYGHTICVCDNQYSGYIRCFDGCATYDGLDKTCQTVRTKYSRCPLIYCPENVNIHASTTNLLSRGSGKGVYRKDRTGNMVSIVPLSNNNHLDPGNDEFYPKPIRGCLLKGQILAEGEIALDGHCGPICTCLNEVTGQMSCTKRCPIYPENDKCDMIPSPKDSCCHVPKCPASIRTPSPTYPKPEIIHALVTPPDPRSLVSKGPIPTDPFNTIPRSKAPLPQFPEPKGTGSIRDAAKYKGPDPSRGNCIYKPTGKVYSEGTHWEVECKENCICIDGKTGRYICTDACKKFNCPPRSTCIEYPDPDYPCCNLLRIIPINSTSSEQLLL